MDAPAQVAEQEPLEIRAPRKVVNGQPLSAEEEDYLVFTDLEQSAIRTLMNNTNRSLLQNTVWTSRSKH